MAGATVRRRRWSGAWPRGRHARWVGAAGSVLALWACSSHRLSVPNPRPAQFEERVFRQNVNHKLDLLFMVDDSNSMGPLQKKMSDQLGTFMDILIDPNTGQLPDMHVAVVSSSFGAGRWGEVQQCHADSYPGDNGGKFVQGPGGPGHGNCGMLHAGAKFLDTGDGSKTAQNFDGDIREAFKCIALLGDTGCAFESQFKSVLYALEYARDPKNEDNGGFLRDDAILAIVMVTNEDDCSVSRDSLMLNPGANSKTDPYGFGALWSYRCNEFGHVCDGKAPPHGAPDDIPMSGVELQNCVSAEDNGPKTDDLFVDQNGDHDPTHGHLWPTVKDFAGYIKGLKPGRENDILVAAIAGPPTPYRVVPFMNVSNNEIDPQIDHSCTFDSGDPERPEYADPAVRINQWKNEFGPNGLFYPICAKTLSTAMTGIAEKIHQTIGSSCVSTDVGWNDPDDHAKGHECQVQRNPAQGTNSQAKPSNVPECQPLVTNAGAPEAPTNPPCYQLIPNVDACHDAQHKTLLRICDNPECKPPTTSAEQTDAAIQCYLPGGD